MCSNRVGSENTNTDTSSNGIFSTKQFAIPYLYLLRDSDAGLVAVPELTVLISLTAAWIPSQAPCVHPHRDRTHDPAV